MFFRFFNNLGDALQQRPTFGDIWLLFVKILGNCFANGERRVDSQAINITIFHEHAGVIQDKVAHFGPAVIKARRAPWRLRAPVVIKINAAFVVFAPAVESPEIIIFAAQVVILSPEGVSCSARGSLRTNSWPPRVKISLYSWPGAALGKLTDHVPSSARSIAMPVRSQSLKSPITRTPSAKGAHTLKCTPPECTTAPSAHCLVICIYYDKN
jgi:hypothetical protein